MIYLFNIIFYSILGFIYETFLKFIFSFDFDSGFLYGPYTLIYGFSITLMFYIFDKIKYNSKVKKIVIYFILTFIIVSLFELIGGYTLEKLFNKVYWNYYEYPLHIGKYVSIPTSIFWGIIMIFLYYFIKPLSNKFFHCLNKKIIITLLIIIFIDLVVTLITKLKI